VQSAAPGTTFAFNLGANSTITFTHYITVPNNITFVGSGAVIFDGGGASSLFFVPATFNASFSGFTFQNSPGDGNSGAINSQGHLTVTGCSFLGNQAINVGGAIYSEGQGTVTDSWFYNNYAGNCGGALLGNLHVSNCTFASNSAGNTGGAISAGGAPYSMFIENSTFFSNHAGSAGGAIGGGTATETLRNLTLYGNSSTRGGGIQHDSRGTMTIESSLIAGNTTPFPNVYAPDIYSDAGPATVLNSLIGDPMGTNLVNGVNGNIVGNGTSIGAFPIANLLGPLQFNGGPTQTMALLNFGALTNPARDHGSNPDNLQFDERGSPFSRTVGAGTDIGAFEFGAVPEIPSAYLALIGAASVVSVAIFGSRGVAAEE